MTPGKRRPLEGPSDEMANKLVKRVHKLRWMGMEEEALQVQQALEGRTERDSVLAVPRDTD
jgi:hypothetical protein